MVAATSLCVIILWWATATPPLMFAETASIFVNHKQIFDFLSEAVCTRPIHMFLVLLIRHLQVLHLDGKWLIRADQIEIEIEFVPVFKNEIARVQLNYRGPFAFYFYFQSENDGLKFCKANFR